METAYFYFKALVCIHSPPTTSQCGLAAAITFLSIFFIQDFESQFLSSLALSANEHQFPLATTAFPWLPLTFCGDSQLYHIISGIHTSNCPCSPLRVYILRHHQPRSIYTFTKSSPSLSDISPCCFHSCQPTTQTATLSIVFFIV